MDLDVVQWASVLTGEVARLPGTMRRARGVVVELPNQLAELIGALDRFSTLLGRDLGEVRDEVHSVSQHLETLQASIDGLAAQLVNTTAGIDEALPTLTQAVIRLEERIVGMDALLGELGGTVVGTINAVPGLRRASRRNSLPPTSESTR